MINYAAKARKAYLINNFDKILNSLNTLHSTVETMTLFVNDQAYNYILKLKEVIKGGPMYRHNVKRFLNDMDKEIKRYNASIYYINKERSEVIADITQAMEDCLMPYIDDLAGAIRAAVWSRGVSEERTEAAVLSLIVSSLAMTSGRLISGGYQIMKEMGGGWGGNPFTFMSIDKIRHLSTSLSDAITGGEIALEEKEANDITKAMDVFIEKMSDSDIVDKVINILEGKGVVTSNNCWCQGDVSDAFKDLMPDNATWATKEEFDKAPVVGHIIEGIGLVFTDREGHEVNA